MPLSWLKESTKNLDDAAMCCGSEKGAKHKEKALLKQGYSFSNESWLEGRQGKRKEFQNLEKRFLRRGKLDRKAGARQEGTTITKREKQIAQQEKEISDRDRELGVLLEDQRRRLENISGMSAQEAKEMLISSIENEARHDAAVLIKKIETEARETADRKAKDIYRGVRGYRETTWPRSGSVVNRQWGNEGRSFGRRAETSGRSSFDGVDLILDDTPEAVISSGFTGSARGRLGVARLVDFGRQIPSAWFEVVVEKVNAISRPRSRIGGAGRLRRRVHGIHPELVKLFGKLKFVRATRKTVCSTSGGLIPVRNHGGGTWPHES